MKKPVRTTRKQGKTRRIGVGGRPREVPDAGLHDLTARAIIVSRGTIAGVLMLSERQVLNLANDGIVIRTEGGRFELLGSIQGYIKYLKTRALKGDVESTEGTKSGRSRLLAARADIAEFERQKLLGELVPAGDVEETWQSIVAAAKTKLLALPTRLAVRLILEKTPQGMQAVLREAIVECLEELAGQVFVEASDDEERETSASSNGSGEDMEAADEADNLAMG